MVGSVKYVNGQLYPGNHTLVINPKSSDHNIKYIYYYIKLCLDFKDLLAGSVIPELNQILFRRSKIPVPPLEVQNRIVEQLDNIYETEIKSSKEVIKSLQYSIDSIMKNTIYRDDLVEYKIKDVCNINFGDRITKKIDSGDKFPVYGGGGCSFYTDKENNRSGFNILIGRFALSGKCIRLITEDIYLNDSGLSIKPNIKEILHKYLGFYMLNIQDIVYNCARGAAQKNLDMVEFKLIKIRIPPPEIQREILKKIEPKERLINHLEKNINRAENEGKEIMSILFN